MGFFIRLLLLVFALMFGTSASLITYSRSRANPIASFDLYRCGNRVCLLGIEPTVTTYDSAKALIRSSPQLIHSPNSENIAYKPSAPSYSFELTTRDSTVYLVEIFLDKTSYLKLGDVIAEFGIPCSAFRDEVGVSALQFSGMMVAGNWPTRLTPDSPVEYIELDDTQTSNCSQAIFDPIFIKWRGFRSYKGLSQSLEP